LYWSLAYAKLLNLTAASNAAVYVKLAILDEYLVAAAHTTMRHYLHWLPVRQHIQYKLCTLVSKCLRRTATSYLADKCIPVSSTAGRQHRSAAHHDLTIPRSGLARYGSRSFATSGPSIWNSLPPTIRD